MTDYITQPAYTQQEYTLTPAELVVLKGIDSRLRYLTLSKESEQAIVGLQWPVGRLKSNGSGVVAGSNFSEPSSRPGVVAANSWCLTLASKQLQLSQLQQLLQFFAAQKWPLIAVDTLAQSEQRTVIRFQLDAGLAAAPVQARARSACLSLGEQLGVDVILQSGESQRIPKLACFDMDSTLIEAEVIDELAKVHGVGAEVARITTAAMEGALDFQQSFRQRLWLLKGLSERRLAQVAKSLPLTPGAKRLLKALQKLGCKNVLLSGGFNYFASFLQANKLAIDQVYANQLDFYDGHLTGRAVEPIVDGKYKAQQLQAIATGMHLSLKQVIAVGDGANDLPMLSLGALGVAYHAKPSVRAAAPQVIDHADLDTVLYLFGLNDQQITLLLS
ncbi:MAG: phosphoserine phosphatase SerB [Gammaproteobacteria bacterium]|nr:phosphoserine phosphatase SerB [Gammaproteobacteria bacterium]